MPKSDHGRGHARRRRVTATGYVETVTRPRKSPPVAVVLCLWRWRWELICVAAIALVYCRLVTPGGWKLEPIQALCVMIAPAPVVLSVRPLRRFIRNRTWCVITRHRVRACLTQMRTVNWSGKLPFIVACFSTETGVVVWLWIRPGLSAEDLEDKAETLAAACWASQVFIGRSERNAALIRIAIDRRKPSAKTESTPALREDPSCIPADDALRIDPGAHDVPQGPADHGPMTQDLAPAQPVFQVKDSSHTSAGAT